VYLLIFSNNLLFPRYAARSSNNCSCQLKQRKQSDCLMFILSY